MLFIIVISSLWIVILRQFSFVHKKNVHRVYVLIFHILESVNSQFFFKSMNKVLKLLLLLLSLLLFISHTTNCIGALGV